MIRQVQILKTKKNTIVFWQTRRAWPLALGIAIGCRVFRQLIVADRQVFSH